MKEILNYNNEGRQIFLDKDKLSKMRKDSEVKFIIKNKNISIEDIETLLSKSEIVIVDSFNGEKVYNIKLCCFEIDNIIEIYGIIFDNPSEKVYAHVCSEEYLKIRSNVSHIEHDDEMEIEKWLFN